MKTVKQINSHSIVVVKLERIHPIQLEQSFPPPDLTHWMKQSSLKILKNLIGIRTILKKHCTNSN